jgi:hypothetical protein
LVNEHQSATYHTDRVGPGAAVSVPACLTRRLHQHLRSLIVARMRRFQARAPGVEATSSNVEPTAERGERIRALFRLDPRELRRWSLAKKALALFRPWRSTRN